MDLFCKLFLSTIWPCSRNKILTTGKFTSTENWVCSNYSNDTFNCYYCYRNVSAYCASATTNSSPALSSGILNLKSKLFFYEYDSKPIGSDFSIYNKQFTYKTIWHAICFLDPDRFKRKNIFI